MKLLKYNFRTLLSILILFVCLITVQRVNAQTPTIPCNNDNIPCPTNTPAPTIDPCVRTKTCPTPTSAPAPTSTPGPAPTSTPGPAATATPVPTKAPTPKPFVPVVPVSTDEPEPTEVTPSPTAKPSPTKSPTPTPERDVQSAFVKAVPSPEDISYDPSVLIKSFFLGLLLLLLILFPAEVFNATLQSNYDEIVGWFKPKWLRGLGDIFDFKFLTSTVSKLPPVVALFLFAAIGSLLNSQLSPGFTFDNASLALVLGVFLTIIILTVAYDILRSFYLKKRFGVRSKLRVHTLGLVTALVMVIVSRLVNFLPGYMYGVFTGLIYSSSLKDEEDGEGLAAATWFLIGITFIGWFALIPVKHAASVDNPSFIILTLQAMLSSLWTSTLTLLVFGMVPIRFLYGEQVKKWNRTGWLIIYTIGIMLFVHTLLDPEQSYYGKSDKVSLVSILTLFVGFGIFSFLFWGYFRYRHLWQRS